MNNGTELAARLHHLPGFHDPFSSMSHLFGAALFLYLGLLLLRRGRGDRQRLIFLGVYVTSCVILMSMSGVYHMMVRGWNARAVMERLDHGAIFLLIAGTLTPTQGILFHGWQRWVPLILMWTAAITGITLKTIFFHDLPEWLGLTFYLGLGWVGAISAGVFWWRYGFSFIKPLLYGGLAYSFGGIMDMAGWPVLIPGVVQPHEVFHLAVLVGAFFHYLFIWQFATGEVSVLWGTLKTASEQETELVPARMGERALGKGTAE
jgi:channel protein (hemolysin III family)